MKNETMNLKQRKNQYKGGFGGRKGKGGDDIIIISKVKGTI